MKEIKFKAWEPLNERMVDCDIISNNEGYEDWQDFEDGISKKIIMQFTGLLDKNGKEIYEGDIIKCNNVDEDHPKWSGFVIFEEGCFKINYPDKRTIPLNIIFCSHLEKGEVVGNIYENKELIK